MSTYTPPSQPRPDAVLWPRGGGLDDAPAINAAMTAGYIPQLMRGQTYRILTAITPPDYAEIRLGGAALSCAVPPVDGILGAAILTTARSVGSTLALASDAVVGSLTISLTSVTNLVVGGYVQLTWSAGFASQIFVVKGISGSGPYTVTLDRIVRFAYPTASTTVNACAPARSIRVRGDGATITATATMDRAIEFGAAWECAIEDVNIVGAFGVGACLDLGSYKSSMRGIYVDGDSTVMGTGIESGSNEGCKFEDCDIRGVGSSGHAKAGLHAYSATSNSYYGVRSQNCATYGAFLGAVSVTTTITTSSTNSVLERCAFDKNATGLLVVDGITTGWRVNDTSASYNSGAGVLFSTHTADPPTGNTLDRCLIRGNGSIGISVAKGNENSLVKCRVMDNGSDGLNITAGATRTSITGGYYKGNTGRAINTADDLRVTGMHESDNVGGGVVATGASNLTAVGCESYRSAGGAGWSAWASQTTGRMVVSQSRVVMAGSPPVSNSYIAVRTQAAGIVSLRDFVVSAGGATRTMGILRSAAGTTKYDESSDFSTAATPLSGGTATTTSSNEVSYG